MRDATDAAAGHTAIARIAARQHGAFARHQVLSAGVSPSQLKSRCRSGVWERLEPCIYRIAGSAPTWHQELWAAVLAAGAGATLSHRAAAGLWHLDGVPSGAVELSLPRGRSYNRCDVHVVTDLGRVDLTTVGRLPVTTAPRTLIDLGAVVDDDTLEQALESALSDRRTSLRQVHRRLEALSRRGRPGLARVRRVLGRRLEGGPSESELETRFVQLLRQARLRAPVRQHEVRLGHGALAA
jgi:hypothetical protein